MINPTQAILFELGRATIEIFDEPDAAVVDQLEVGERVSRCPANA
jgi:hypothetical protein